tara:strand:- start:254 stop:679 length:426 start_codon:yes stop_codon:yes gene_type:complete
MSKIKITKSQLRRLVEEEIAASCLKEEKKEKAGAAYRKAYQAKLDKQRAEYIKKHPVQKPAIPTIAMTKLKRPVTIKKPDSPIHDEEEAKVWFKRKTDSKSPERDEVLYGFYGSDMAIAMPYLAQDPDEGYYFYYRQPDWS